ncbi:hypothetical protein ACWGIU_18045 [Streptomyces sp. NPDC054840]
MPGPAISDLSTGDTITPDAPPVCCGTVMNQRPYTNLSTVWTCCHSEDTQIHADLDGRITEQPYLDGGCENELHH